MNPIAAELNATLDGTIVSACLSPLGRRLYFPKGIIAQSQEAKKLAKNVDATIGIATEGGKPMHFQAIAEALPGLTPEEAFPYAPTAGVPALREAWKAEILEKNPGLAGKSFSSPVVVTGLTQAISIVAELFIAEGDVVLAPDLFWDNYGLILKDRARAELRIYPFFDQKGRLNLAAMARELEALRGRKILVTLNFPNNPTGYSPTQAEAQALAELLADEADKGSRFIALCDDAYFGLFFEEGIRKESLFSELADRHENILAIKADAATKEELVWGLRVGFLSFAAKGLKSEHHEALIQKVMGSIRASISCSSTPGQHLVLKALKSPGHRAEKERAFEVIRERYRIAKDAVAAMRGPLVPLPFNSGYFMSFDTMKGGAETLRKALLEQKGIGTISFGDRYLRVAFSSVDAAKLPGLFAAIDEVAARVLA